MANRANGSASARAKPNMPTAGARMLPVEATSTSRSPTIGHVHENDTSTKVNAIRNMLSTPDVFSLLRFTAFVHDEGRLSSNPPRKLAANSNRSKKKKMLKTAFVESSFILFAP